MEARQTDARALLLGNWPDPTIVRSGSDYYMTHSSFLSRSGPIIWRSHDMKRWNPIARAPVPGHGSVWAPDLVRHDGRFYLYYPVVDSGSTIWVTTADSPAGPWSEPVNTGGVRIDPGHVVDDDGTRYLHVSGGRAYRLSEDGLSVVGELEQVYDGWPIPDDWAIECPCLESPKLLRRGDWYYLVSAQGGTFGPSTSHMVIASRSRDPMGPFENSPYNPVIRTRDRGEAWWSKGHGSLVEGPDGRWYCVLHGIRNGNRSMGRCTIVEPIEWTHDGWFRVAGRWPEGWDDVPVPAGATTPVDDGRWNLAWCAGEVGGRATIRGDSIELHGAGSCPADSGPLIVNPRSPSYVLEATVDVTGDTTAGILLWDTAERYLGLGLTPDRQVPRVQAGCRRYRRTEEPAVGPGPVSMRIVNDRQDVRFYVRHHGGWRICQPSMEISDWGSTTCAVFAAGNGTGTLSGVSLRCES